MQGLLRGTLRGPVWLKWRTRGGEKGWPADEPGKEEKCQGAFNLIILIFCREQWEGGSVDNDRGVGEV